MFAAARRAFADEEAAIAGVDTASALYDIEGFYDHTDWDKLIAEARASSYPLRLFVIAAHAHLGPRIRKVGEAAAARSGCPAMYMSSAMARMSRSGYLSRRSARILRVSRQYKKLPQAQPCITETGSETMASVC